MSIQFFKLYCYICAYKWFYKRYDTMKNEVLAYIESDNGNNLVRQSFIPDDYYMRRVSHFAHLNVGADDIVMLGDSLINGGEWHELLQDARMKNRGINGDTVEGVRQRLSAPLQGKPRQVFIMVGINDVSHDLPARDIAYEIVYLAQHIHRLSPHTAVYIHSLLPFDAHIHYASLRGKESDVVAINEILAAASEEFDYTYINLYPHFVTEQGIIDTQYSNDGLHLTGTGYALWARLLQPYIL